MELSNGELLSRDIQQSEQEFLDETVTDNEDSDEGERNDDCDFNDELEVAAEVIVNTSCCSIDEEVMEMLSRTCGCTKRNGGPCSRELTSEDVSEYRLAITELSSSELDIAILAQLHAGMNVGELLTNSRGVCRPDTRQRVTFQYAFKAYLLRNVPVPPQDKPNKIIQPYKAS